jgi:hypothetical protein
MIQVLGLKRVIGISFLLFLNILVGGLMYLYFLPGKEDAERELRVTRAAIASDRAAIEKLREDYEFFQKQKSLYAELGKIGFFTDQDRFRAPERLESIKKVSRLIRARYEIGSAKKKENIHAEKAGHVLLSTPVKIYDIEAMDDVDIYSFIYWIENAFTGQTSITKLEMKRAYDLNEAVIRQIGGGIATPLITGSINFEWRTMISQEKYEESGAGSGMDTTWQ